MDKIRARR